MNYRLIETFFVPLHNFCSILNIFAHISTPTTKLLVGLLSVPRGQKKFTFNAVQNGPHSPFYELPVDLGHRKTFEDFPFEALVLFTRTQCIGFLKLAWPCSAILLESLRKSYIHFRSCLKQGRRRSKLHLLLQHRICKRSVRRKLMM